MREPLCQQRRAGKVNAACRHWLSSDRWSPGAIRQTNDSFITTCRWRVINSALFKPYLQEGLCWLFGGRVVTISVRGPKVLFHSVSNLLICVKLLL